MHKPTVTLLIIIFLVAISLADSNISEEDCLSVYYFQIDHLKPGNILNYSEQDVSSLSEQLNLTLNETFSYLNNYSAICSNSPKIPSPIKETTQTSEEFGCRSVEINKTIAYVYDADWSIPTPKIHLGEYSCSRIEYYKYFLRYEKTGRSDYSITGVRIWIFVLSLISIGLLLYFRLHFRANRLIRKNKSI